MAQLPFAKSNYCFSILASVISVGLNFFAMALLQLGEAGDHGLLACGTCSSLSLGCARAGNTVSSGHVSTPLRRRKSLSEII